MRIYTRLYANNKIGKRWLPSWKRRRDHKWERQKGNERSQKWSMRFSHVNDNNFTVNTYFRHTEKTSVRTNKRRKKILGVDDDDDDDDLMSVRHSATFSFLWSIETNELRLSSVFLCLNEYMLWRSEMKIIFIIIHRRYDDDKFLLFLVNIWLFFLRLDLLMVSIQQL